MRRTNTGAPHLFSVPDVSPGSTFQVRVFTTGFHIHSGCRSRCSYHISLNTDTLCHR